MRWTAHWITNLHFLWWRTVGRSQRPSHTCGTIIIPWESPWRHAASIIRITRAASWKRPTTTYKMSIVAESQWPHKRGYTRILHTFINILHFFTSSAVFSRWASDASTGVLMQTRARRICHLNAITVCCAHISLVHQNLSLPWHFESVLHNYHQTITRWSLDAHC